MTDRRFTDKEVALILRRASDLETRSPRSGASARGLTLKDLEEIASEVGIDPALVVRAVAELEGPRGLGSSSLVVGPGPVRREVRAVPRELSREELAELIRVVEIDVEGQGTVAEALGSVRWTSKGRFLSTQVSFEPSRGETLMRVEERYSQALRGILHGIPASYGAIFGLAWALEGLSLGAGGGSIVALVSASLGWGLGSGVWQVISSRSRSRVQKLAEKLGLKAQEVASDDPPERLPQG